MKLWIPLILAAGVVVTALLPASASSQAAHDDLLSLRAIDDRPLATIGLRPLPAGHSHTATGVSASDAPACDKDIDVAGSIAGVSFVAAQNNGICTSADIDVYELSGEVHVVQAGGQDAAFTISHIAADGTPTLITQKFWAQTNTSTPDVKAFSQGTRRYIALSLERLALGNAACGVVIVDVTDAPATPIVDQVIGDNWCDVHNSFVEDDTNGDGRYLYLTADFPNDLRVLDIGDLNNVSEIGRYTHPEASNSTYVHDVTVIDHGAAVGRRVYVSYWDAGLMILDATDVTPGVIEAGSPKQPLNPDHSIDHAGFLTHHAYPNDDGTRLFIQDEFLASPGDEPVQMWDVSSPVSPSYVDGISLGSALMPVINPAHNLLVDGDRLYVGWYKAGLQAFAFDGAGFVGRLFYHQVQTEAADDPYDGAWGVRLVTIGTTTYIVQSDRRYGLILDSVIEPVDSDGDGLSDEDEVNVHGTDPLNPDTDGDAFGDGREVHLGTDANDSCADTTGADDEVPPDAWPVDFNDDQGASLQDVIFAFVTTLAPNGLNQPATGPLVRVDLNGDGFVSLQDLIFGYVTTLAPEGLNKTCTP